MDTKIRFLIANKLTGKIVVRDLSRAEAASILNTSTANVYNQAFAHSFGAGWLYVRFDDEYDPEEKIAHNYPVLVTDLETGQDYLVSSSVALARKLSMTQDAVCKAVNKGFYIRHRFKVVALRKVGQYKVPIKGADKRCSCKSNTV